MPRHQGSLSHVPIALGCVLGALALPATALGATANVGGGTLTFTAAPGEVNDVLVEADGANFGVIDSTSPLTAAGPCVQRSAHRVNCPAAGVTLVRALLADGDDAAVTVIGTTDADLQGGSGADTLLSSDGDDTLSAGKSRFGGNDVLSSAGGDDTLIGSPTQAGGSVSMSGGPGDDQLLGGATSDGLFGDLGADLLKGGGGFDNVFWAGGAGVTVTSGAGANDGEAGEGDDLRADVEFINLTGFDDNFTGGPGNELVNGLGGNDTIAGGPGDDSIDGGDNADTISGDAGGDTLQGDKRADDISGGEGIDEADYTDHQQSVNVTVNNVANDGSSAGAEGDNVHTDVENLTGTDQNDVLIGSAEDNRVTGGDGNDDVQGAGGEDELFGDSDFGTAVTGDDDLGGGDGDDSLAGGPGADDYAGGPDIDVADYSRLGTLPDLTVTINNVADDGTAGGAEGDNVRDTVENVTGSGGNDTITGSSAANTLQGGFGLDELRGANGPDLLDGETPGACCGSFAADILNGGGGNDTVTYASHSFNAVTVDIGGAPDGASGGVEGDDVQSTVENLIGSESSDTLTGNNQPNSIAGRNGFDLLIGGAAADHLAGNSNSDIHEGQGGKDEIRSLGDGVSDTDNCGTEADTAIADAFDTVNADCEDVIP